MARDCGVDLTNVGSARCVRDRDFSEIRKELTGTRVAIGSFANKHAVLSEEVTRINVGLMELIRTQSEFRNATEDLKTLIGEPPDPSTGRAGTGLRGRYAIALRTTARRTFPSIRDTDAGADADSDEGEDTSIQDRTELVARLKLAEFAERKQNRLFWLKLFAAAGGGAGILELVKFIVQAFQR